MLDPGYNLENPTYLNLTINMDGNDVLDRDLFFRSGGIRDRGIGGIGELIDSPTTQFNINTDLLTNSSVRVGIRGDDAWAPQKVLVMGKMPHPSTSVTPLAIETDLDVWLSSENEVNAKLTIPIRLVNWDVDNTLIRRVLLLIGTAKPIIGGDEPESGMWILI